jgi:hypothetical protein
MLDVQRINSFQYRQWSDKLHFGVPSINYIAGDICATSIPDDWRNAGRNDAITYISIDP